MTRLQRRATASVTTAPASIVPVDVDVINVTPQTLHASDAVMDACTAANIDKFNTDMVNALPGILSATVNEREAYLETKLIETEERFEKALFEAENYAAELELAQERIKQLEARIKELEKQPKAHPTPASQYDRKALQEWADQNGIKKTLKSARLAELQAGAEPLESEQVKAKPEPSTVVKYDRKALQAWAKENNIKANLASARIAAIQAGEQPTPKEITQPKKVKGAYNRKELQEWAKANNVKSTLTSSRLADLMEKREEITQADRLK